jgi:hypothetical protein
MRDFAIREIGCIVARKHGLGFLPCEKHHLLSTGLHGNGKRRGEKATIGLNEWSHRGVVLPGWTRDECRKKLGPSYAKEPRTFRELIGTDDELLAYQNELIERWKRGTV